MMLMINMDILIVFSVKPEKWSSFPINCEYRLLMFGIYPYCDILGVVGISRGVPRFSVSIWDFPGVPAISRGALGRPGSCSGSPGDVGISLGLPRFSGGRRDFPVSAAIFHESLGFPGNRRDFLGVVGIFLELPRFFVSRYDFQGDIAIVEESLRFFASHCDFLGVTAISRESLCSIREHEIKNKCESNN